MSEYQFEIGNFAPTGAGWPKISGRMGYSPPTILLAKWSFVWYKNLDRSFLCFVTIHTFDKWTDGWTTFSSL